ncbi:hypothetical protein [Tenacibaculum singaporense]|uniref:VWFA domain-containing protein n=1 Tax=Tenacibaculum singaporense TaxID=2358479 RepID=A0A3Q8RN35_9FLAO|nr:hypothetical protein [Tenacibaculum singaporense]AZJ35539.1 hypothetical protein D6T69_08390 [Tenacibaculum singaporense]
MKAYKLIIVTLCIILTYSCSNKKEKDPVAEVSKEISSTSKKKSKENLNISIVLDLSDRINPKKYPEPSMEFYQRDLGYIESVAKTFQNHIRGKRTNKINDKIQLFVEPAPSDSELNQKIATLKTQFDKTNATKEEILKTAKKYIEICNNIYETAITDDKYVGSDIRGFFKNKIQDYCVEEGYKNVVVVLTDGYVYHKDNLTREQNRTSYLVPKTIRSFKLNKGNWKEKFQSKDYGFLPLHKNLQNVEVLVLGVNPDKKNPYEEDVIKEYWKKWLTEMNVKKFQIKRADLPIHINDVINDFILTK